MKNLIFLIGIFLTATALSYSALAQKTPTEGKNGIWVADIGTSPAETRYYCTQINEFKFTLSEDKKKCISPVGCINRMKLSADHTTCTGAPMINKACDPDSKLFGSKCFSCPTGFTLNRNGGCDAGKSTAMRIEKAANDIPICPLGSTLSADKKTCTAPAACPEGRGYVLSADKATCSVPSNSSDVCRPDQQTNYGAHTCTGCLTAGWRVTPQPGAPPKCMTTKDLCKAAGGTFDTTKPEICVMPVAKTN